MMDIKNIVTQQLRETFPSFAGAVSGENTKKEPLYITCCLKRENYNVLFEVKATVEDGHITYLDGYGSIYWSQAEDRLKKYKNVVFKLITAGAVNFVIRIVGD